HGHLRSAIDVSDDIGRREGLLARADLKIGADRLPGCVEALAEDGAVWIDTGIQPYDDAIARSVHVGGSQDIQRARCIGYVSWLIAAVMLAPGLRNRCNQRLDVAVAVLPLIVDKRALMPGGQ